MSGIMQMVANNVAPASPAPAAPPTALLYLDPGNSSSYSGSGSTWTDLSGNTNDATLVGSPTWTNAGTASYFSFNGTDSQYASTVASKYNQSYTGKTVIAVIRPSASAWTNGVDQYRGIFGTSAGTRNFNTYIHHDSSNNLQIHFSANGVGGFSNNISLPSDQWSIVAVTQTTGGLVTYYLNGQAVGTNSGITFAQYTGSNTENIARLDNYWLGDIGVTAIYGQALSAEQIQQNYTTLTAQYGMVTNNLVAYYDPELSTSYPGTGTTLYDISGNELNGTMSNITYTDPYFAYNGTSSQVSIADNALLEPGSGDWTMEAWVYLSATSGGRVIMGKFDPGGGSQDVSYSMRSSGLNTFAQFGDGSGAYINSTTYTATLNTWFQLVHVWTNVAANTLVTYANGVSVGSVSHTLPSLLNTPSNLYLGSYNNGEYAQYLSGRIGIVRLYNRALTATEVLQNYNVNRNKYGI
jgi:hypothetical protein